MVKEEENISKRIAKFDVSLKQAINNYLMITKPMHKLGNKHIEILTLILYSFTKEQGNFKREEDAWKIVFGKESLIGMREQLDLAKSSFYNYIYQLRQKKVILGNKVNPVYNPLIREGCKTLEITFRFNIIDNAK